MRYCCVSGSHGKQTFRTFMTLWSYHEASWPGSLNIFLDLKFCHTSQCWCVPALHADDEFGAEAGAPSHPTLSTPQSHSSSSADLADQGSLSIPPPNYSTIQVPPGSHAPANTPADLPHTAGKAWTSSCHSSVCLPVLLLHWCGMLSRFLSLYFP